MKKFACHWQSNKPLPFPSIHGIFAETLGLDIQYDAVEVEIQDFEEKLNSLFSQGYIGLNVTLPLKEKAFSVAKKHTETCSAARSANTLWKEGGVLCADSTDGAGLMEDLISKDLKVKGSNIVVLGAGGSSKQYYPVC